MCSPTSAATKSMSIRATTRNPLVSMAAAFRVDEIDDQRSRASAVFRYEHQPTLRGALLAAGMPAVFAIIMRRITNGWAVEAEHRAAGPTAQTRP